MVFRVGTLFLKLFFMRVEPKTYAFVRLKKTIPRTCLPGNY